MSVENARGNYSFLPGIGPFSSGAVASKGYEGVRVTLATPLPYRKGFGGIDRFLYEQGRPPQELCGIELRSPRPMTFAEFDSFNQGYIELLKERDILVEGVNPVARTNVAPAMDPPAEAVLYAFSYTTPAKDSPVTFVVAGGGAVVRKGEKASADDIIRRGDVSVEGMREKANHVLGLMEKRLAGLGVGWAQVTGVDVYTVQNIFPLLETLLLPRLGPAKRHGFRWQFARPPLQEVEFEMNMRGLRRELVVDL